MIHAYASRSLDAWIDQRLCGRSDLSYQRTYRRCQSDAPASLARPQAVRPNRQLSGMRSRRIAAASSSSGAKQADTVAVHWLGGASESRD